MDQPEILTMHGNMAVVRIPGRRFPGIWIAADTTTTLLDFAEEIVGVAPDSEAAGQLAEQLRLLVKTYSNDMRSLGEPLPFAPPPY